MLKVRDYQGFGCQIIMDCGHKCCRFANLLKYMNPGPLWMWKDHFCSRWLCSDNEMWLLSSELQISFLSEFFDKSFNCVYIYDCTLHWNRSLESQESQLSNGIQGNGRVVAKEEDFNLGVIYHQQDMKMWKPSIKRLPVSQHPTPPQPTPQLNSSGASSLYLEGDSKEKRWATSVITFLNFFKSSKSFNAVTAWIVLSTEHFS